MIIAGIPAISFANTGGFATSPAVLSAGLTSSALNMTASAGGNLGETTSHAGGSFRVTARVPIACWIRDEGGAPVFQNGTGEGNVVEACNNPHGFRVEANYRQLTTGERAVIQYGDSRVSLPAAGQATLRQSSQPQVRRVRYQVDSENLSAPLVLALSIAPI